MKILYAISTLGKGVGGHYFSYKTIIESLENEITPILLNLQIRESIIFEEMDFKKFNINIKTINLYSITKKIYSICKKEDIDCIHVFDIVAYSFLRNLFLFYKLPIIVTVCGGPIPTGFFPKINTLTLFSLEQYNYFNEHKDSYNIEDLSLIPNRVNNFKTNQIKIDKLVNTYNLTKIFTIMRISRISKYYEKSLLQSIDLVKELNNKGTLCKLLLIGQISDIEVYNEIKEKSDSNIIVITDEYYFKNAKELIGASKLNIATGRSVMESMSKSIPTLTPSSTNKYPILLDSETFKNCFFSNFSERSKVSLSDDKNLEKIEKIITDNNYNKYSKFSKDMYTEFFNVSEAKEKYLDIYKNTKINNINILDTIKHLIKTYVMILSHSTVINKKTLKKFISLFR